MSDYSKEDSPLGSYPSDCLKRRVIFFTGKGGVGKSTLAWATALVLKRQNRKVAVVGWSPFDAVARPFASTEPGIDWIALDTLGCFREYALKTLKFERVYDTVFENHVFKTFIQAAPGLSETVIAGKVWDLYDSKLYDTILVDLPSSGHALSFFQSPKGIQKLFAVGFVHKEATRICSMFTSSDTRVDLVATPEELPIVECLELKQKLEALFPFHFGYLHLNQVVKMFPLPDESVLSRLPESAREPLIRYRADRESNDAARTLAKPLEISTQEIPQFTAATARETIELTAAVLEAS